MADGTTIQIEAQDTAFERRGTTQQSITHSTSDNGPQLETVMGTIIAVQKPAFARTALGGLATLTALYGEPGDYEASTAALYDRTLATAYAMAQTGPTAVRGGTARIGFALAEAVTLTGLNRFKEIWTALTAWAQIKIEAIARYNEMGRAWDQQTLADNEQYVMAGHAYAQSAIGFVGQVNALNQAKIQAYAASRHYGSQVMITTEALTGMGTQDSAAKNAFGSSSYR